MTTLKKSFIGSLLLVTDSLFKKSVGLLSTLVLARVLVPEDFGIIAIATLMTGFLYVFAYTGTDQFIIRSDEPNDDILNTAFTVNFLIRSLLAVTLAIGAYFVADHYSDPRLVSLLHAYATSMFISGLNNPAINLLRRNQEYRKIVKMTMVVKVISAASAVTVALIFESYWALALGQFLSITLATVGGYIIYPYRPSFHFTDMAQQWRFSGWLIPQSLLGYFRTQFDTLLVSDTLGQSKLGSYHTMKYLAFIPNSEFLRPATEPLLAQLSPLRDNPRYFNKRYTIASIVTFALAIPASVFLYHYAHQIVHLLMGENWLEYSDLFKWFALLIPAYAMFNNANRTFLIFAQTKFTLHYEILCAVVIISTLLLYDFKTVFELAAIKVLLELLLSSVYFTYAAQRYTSTYHTLQSFLVALLILAIALLWVYSIKPITQHDNPFIELAIEGGLFAIGYGATLLAIMHFTRSRSYVSGYLYELIFKGVKKIRKRGNN